MRELSLWDGDGLEGAFTDIDDLVRSCRFSNCSHNGEPGCAIAAALVDGSLPRSTGELAEAGREAAHHERRVDALARAGERRKWKLIGKSVTRHMKAKYGTEGWR